MGATWFYRGFSVRGMGFRCRIALLGGFGLVSLLMRLLPRRIYGIANIILISIKEDKDINFNNIILDILSSGTGICPRSQLRSSRGT